MNLPITNIVWSQAHRLINAAFPKVDYFDDIAEPNEWGALENIIGRSYSPDFGNLNLVPNNRRIQGDGSGWVMNTFTHASKEYPSRFTDGSFGVYYCAKDFDTAVHETCYHSANFLKSTNERKGWVMKKRHLVTSVDEEFHDLSRHKNSKYLDKDNYKPAQQLATSLRANKSNGIFYPSVRYESGECLAIFWPDIVGFAKDTGIWQYHFNGERIDYIRRLDDSANSEMYAIVP